MLALAEDVGLEAPALVGICKKAICYVLIITLQSLKMINFPAVIERYALAFKMMHMIKQGTFLSRICIIFILSGLDKK